MPKRSTGVHLRSGSNVYQWRVKVPLDLTPLYPGKQWAHRGTLGTSDLREANLKAARLNAEWQETFARQRKGTSVVDRLTPDHGRAIAHVALQSLLADEAVRLNKADRAMMLRHFARLGPIGMMVYGSDLGMAFDQNTPGAQEAFGHFLMTLNGPMSAHVAELPKETPITPQKARKLRDVFKEWKRLQGHTVTADTIRARERALELYEQATGNPPLQDITRAMGHEFAQWLTSLKGARKTASDRLKYVSSLLKFACRELEWTERHPWEGIDIDYTTETERKPWTPDHIRGFFALPLFTSYALPQRAARAGADAAYWVPLLGLFTGARVGELVQLKVADIVQAEGVWCIDINEDEGKRLKTENSKRQVPIHSELIRLGFLDYLQDIKDAGHSGLWPTMHLNEEKPSLGFSRWFNETPRRDVRDNEGKPVDIPDFHSLRHLVRSTMAAANVPEADQDLITGHATRGSTGTRVYRHTTMQKLRAAVEAIQYPSFALERAYSREKLGVDKAPKGKG